MTGLVLSAVVTFLLQPLMASLIKEQGSTFVKDIATYRPLDFSGTRQGDLAPYEWNLILSSVTAEDLHTGEPSPWTNKTHAFRPLDPQIDFSNQKVTLTAASTAYTAHLSCERAADVVLQVDHLGIQDGTARVNITARDRNCHIFYDFNLTLAHRPLVSEAFQQTACGLSNSLSRVLLFTATASGTETVLLDNTVLTSCIVAYSSTDGELTVSWVNGTTASTGLSKVAPTFVSFRDTKPVTPKKDFMQEAFESDLLGIREVQYGTRDEQVASTKFAEFVMTVAVKLLAPNPGSGSSSSSSLVNSGNGTSINTSLSSETARAIIEAPQVLLHAMPLAFASIYRVVVANTLMIPARGGVEDTVVTGLLETTETRLWVRYWLVAVTMAYLVLSAGSSVWLTRWWGWTVRVGEQNQTGQENAVGGHVHNPSGMQATSGG